MPFPRTLLDLSEAEVKQLTDGFPVVSAEGLPPELRAAARRAAEATARTANEEFVDRLVDELRTTPLKF